LQAGKAHSFAALPVAARHDVRAIAHAIDGARYDLHGFVREGFVFFPANHHHAGEFPMLDRAGANFRAACGLSIAGTEIWESVRRDGWGRVLNRSVR
jgi:hypothetical protein